MLFLSQATLEMKGVKEMKALLDILELDSSVYVRIQVRSVCGKLSGGSEGGGVSPSYALKCTTRRLKYAPPPYIFPH